MYNTQTKKQQHNQQQLKGVVNFTVKYRTQLCIIIIVVVIIISGIIVCYVW